MVTQYAAISIQVMCTQCIFMYRAGQNCLYSPYMTVYLVTSLPKYRIYTLTVLASLTHLSDKIH